MSDLLDAAHAAAKLARAHGADEAAIYVSRSRGVEVEWRDGRLERVQEETRRSLSAELYVNGRYSASSTNDLRPAALEAFLREAVEMTRLLEPDLYRGLPDPARYPKDVTLDLDLCDPGFEAVTGEARRAQAELLEQQVRALADDLSIISVTSGVGDSHGQSARVHTNGFEGEREGTTFSMSVMVTVKDADGRRPMGWDYTYRRHRGELLPTDKLARTAVDRARSQLGAGRLATGKYTLVVDPKAVPRLLGALFSPLSGPALQQRRSLFEDRLNTPIASKLLTIIDEPHRKRGLGASLWDG
ncbi:MAG: TldD/PmbA family protein, partial [Myxococcales bacterium]|nr:TldD/PmbA family protein [Myxococcales bacterium]